MNWVYLISGGWLLHCALGGGLLLLLVYGLMRRTGQPARQQRLGEWGLVAALLVAVLSLCPAWLVIPIHLAPSNDVPPSTRADVSPATQAVRRELPQPGPASGPSATEVPPKGEKGGAVPLDISRWRLTMPAEEAEPAAPVSLAAPAAPPAATSAPPCETPQPLGFVPPGIAPLLFSSLAPLGRLFALVWAGVAAVLLGRWLLGHLLLWRLLWLAEPAPEPVARLLAEMTGGRHRPRLLVSRRLRVPLSCGLLRPTVVLPAALCEPTPVLRWVLAHELTHLERRDVWTCLLFGLGQVLYFYLPWFWWLQRQVGLCQEYLADAAVADQEARPEEYAEFLVSLTTGPAAPAFATGVSGRPSELYRRVTMLLEAPVRLEKRCPWFWSWTAACGLGLAAVLVAGVGLVAAPLGEIEDRGSRIENRESRIEDPESRIEDRESKGEDRKERSADSNTASILDPRSSILDPREFIRSVKVRRPDGVMADQLNLPPGVGLVVERVDLASAAQAGLREYDILLALGSQAVSSSPADLARLLDEIQPGAPVEVVVLRKGQRETLRSLVRAPAATRPPKSLAVAPRPPQGPPLAGPVPAGANVVTTLAWVGDRFTTRHQEGTLVITISGTRAGSQLRVAAIEVADGAVTVHFDDAACVPARYGDKARYLLELSAAADPLPRPRAP
jgi:beta-lactamase regulating signal transducer with metallopeptidase domain